MGIVETIILAIVEGITEFLPISSTGHMIIAGSLMNLQNDEFTKIFEVAIQSGAILAVIVFYWRRFFKFRRWQFYFKLIIGVLPALLLGYLLGDFIDKLLESPLTVAVSLLLGGVVLLFVDKIFNTPYINTDDQISYKQSLLIGCWQVLALIPGVSRSAASIIGGMQQKLSRSIAAEFSFFLAVPTMFAATAYELFLKKFDNHLRGIQIICRDHQTIFSFLLGSAIAFIVALAAIKYFIDFLKKHGFKTFGIYRIIVGAILLILIFSNIIK